MFKKKYYLEVQHVKEHNIAQNVNTLTCKLTTYVKFAQAARRNNILKNIFVTKREVI